MKRFTIMTMALVALMAFTVVSCAKGGSAGGKLPSIDSIKLGKDNTKLKASIKVLTHRTDIIDSKFAEYIAEFNKLYPNIAVKYEGITDYAQDMTIRLTTDDWGDICMIPTTIDKADAPAKFVSFGKKENLEKTYDFLSNWTFEGQVYGIPSTANGQGILYNKRIFKEAGVDPLPKTPDEFIEALKKIKATTKAIPLYTNFAAGWTMGAWDYYMSGATGDPDFMNTKLAHSKDPFADKGDGTGPFAVYSVLYQAVAQGLIEKDPTTTDWEGCKGMMNRGEIATMALGSWAYTQMQQAGDHPEDIGYMPFPITVAGKQYAGAGPDYCFGINAKASQENKLASMIYVKWLTEKSQFAFTEGGLPVVRSDAKPELYQAFDGVSFVVDNPAPAGEETLFNDMNTESEVGITKENKHVQDIVEAAFKKTRSLEDIVGVWNSKWDAAQKKLGVKVE